MAEAMAILTLLCFEATPEHGTAFPGFGKPPHGECEGKSAGRREVSIGFRRHVMEARDCQPLAGQMLVEG
jgi:hypothetical protein